MAGARWHTGRPAACRQTNVCARRFPQDSSTRTSTVSRHGHARRVCVSSHRQTVPRGRPPPAALNCGSWLPLSADCSRAPASQPPARGPFRGTTHQAGRMRDRLVARIAGGSLVPHPWLAWWLVLPASLFARAASAMINAASSKTRSLLKQSPWVARPLSLLGAASLQVCLARGWPTPRGAAGQQP